MPQPPHKWPLFLIVATGVFMSTLDSSMVNIALPSIMKEFHSSLHLTEWVVMIYLLTITVSLLFFGHLADLLGRRTIYSLGMLLFGGFSFFCATASHIFLLIVFRFGQALGAAMMMSAGPAIIKENYPIHQLGRQLGLIGVAVGLGLMAGPALGGVLIEFFAWRSIFYLTVPIGLIFSVLAIIILPRHPLHEKARKMDLIGSLGWAFAIILFVLALSTPLLSKKFLVLISFSLLTFTLFIWHENRTPHPILPMYFIRQRLYSSALFSALLSFIVLFSVIILTPFYLDRILALPASQIGMVMMAIPLAVMVVSPLSGRLADSVDARYLTTLGLIICTFALVLLGGLDENSSPVSIAVRLVLLGAGQALFLSPNNASVLANVKNNQAGASAGLLATARNLGMLLGVAMVGLIFSISFSTFTGGLDMKDYTPAHSLAFLRALHLSFQATAAVGIIGIVVSWVRGKTLPEKNQQGRQ